jgi:hypothetical protein
VLDYAEAQGVSQIVVGSRAQCPTTTLLDGSLSLYVAWERDCIDFSPYRQQVHLSICQLSRRRGASLDVDRRGHEQSRRARGGRGGGGAQRELGRGARVAGGRAPRELDHRGADDAATHELGRAGGADDRPQTWLVGCWVVSDVDRLVLTID